MSRAGAAGAAEASTFRRAASRGLVPFLAGTLVGQAVSMAEYAASGGAYRPWTWVKVGFLYLLSFCGVTLRATAEGRSPVGLRLPLLAGTAAVAWLLWRAGHRSRRPWEILVSAVAFAVPVAATAFVATLRFVDQGIEISPIGWQGIVFPLAIAVALIGVGWLSREPGRRPGIWVSRVMSAVSGGWRMLAVGLWLATLSVALLAGVKPQQARAYGSFLAGLGTSGAVIAGHHALALPNQSVLTLAVAGGSEIVVAIGSAEPPAKTIRLTLAGIRFSPDVVPLLGVPPEPGAVALGGGFYLFLSVPAVATFFGGRLAGKGWRSARERAARGAGAGLVYAVLLTGLASFAGLAVGLPIPPADVVAVSLEAPTWLVAVSALAWGIGGGLVGALTSPFGST